MRHLITAVAVATATSAALAGTTVSNYDDLSEGNLGTSFSYNGVTYTQANGVGGVFPGGDTFTPADVGDSFIIERATLLYNDFPNWGSANNALTFGTAFIPGDNLSLGAFVRATMTLDEVASAASMQMAFYENGPWGGIVFQLDALRNGSVVASDSFSISDLGGRDNLTFSTLSVSGAEFDTLYLSATYNGEFSAPRLMIDNLSITSVPAPAGASALALGALAARRRRR